MGVMVDYDVVVAVIVVGSGAVVVVVDYDNNWRARW